MYQCVINKLEGSSPRVRSRPPGCNRVQTCRGIISACAEQTRSTRAVTAKAKDHLRVCGADSGVLCQELVEPGSSPRVRSRRHDRRPVSGLTGIISACAEQTVPVVSVWSPSRDHLRVCGADWRLDPRKTGRAGSSPRVRSRLGVSLGGRNLAGIISACAEQTVLFEREGVPWEDHLRVCGADRVRATPGVP